MSSRHKNNMNSFLQNGHHYGSKKGYTQPKPTGPVLKRFYSTPSKTANELAKMWNEATKIVPAQNEVLEAVMNYILNDLPKSIYIKMHFTRLGSTSIRISKNREYCEVNRWHTASIDVKEDYIQFSANSSLLTDVTSTPSAPLSIKVQLADPELFDHIYNAVLKIYNT